MTDTDTPPRRRRTSTDNPTPPKESYSAGSPGVPIKTLEKKLAAMIGGMALPFAAAGDMHCAGLIATRADPIAEAWANLANQSPAVRRVLESMLRGGAWAGAIGTTLPVFIGVAAHHNLIPPQFAKPFEMVIFGPGEPDETTTSENGNGAPPTDDFHPLGGFPPPPTNDSVE